MIYCENIVNVTLFFLNSSPDFDNHFFFKKKFHLFWQWHCHNSIPLFPFPFSTMALPQLPKKKKKKFHLFRQYHCQNYQFFFFFFTYFGNTIATILFFFFLTFSVKTLPQLPKKQISSILAIPLPQFYFFFFSSHFRLWHCQNRKNFPPISVIPLPQFYLFIYFFYLTFSAMVLPK